MIRIVPTYDFGVLITIRVLGEPESERHLSPAQVLAAISVLRNRLWTARQNEMISTFVPVTGRGDVYWALPPDGIRRFISALATATPITAVV